MYHDTHMCTHEQIVKICTIYECIRFMYNVRCTYRWQACQANRTNKEHDYSNWSQLFRLPQFPWISTLVKRKCGNRVRKTVRSNSAIAPKKKSPLLPLKASSWQAEVNNEPRATVKRNRKLNALFFFALFLTLIF